MHVHYERNLLDFQIPSRVQNYSRKIVGVVYNLKKPVKHCYGIISQYFAHLFATSLSICIIYKNYAIK